MMFQIDDDINNDDNDNHSALINALASKGPTARCQIAFRYKEKYGQTLKELMGKECGTGDLGLALQFLAVPPDEADCDIIHKACKGLGADQLLLYPVVLGRSNRDMIALKKKFFEVYSADLGVYLDAELGGDFEALIFHCLQAMEVEYDPNYHTEEKVKEDADEFYKMGQGKWGTDEKGLFKLLCGSPPDHLKQINKQYEAKYKHTLRKAMEKELSGTTRDATLHLLEVNLNPACAVATLIDKSMLGFGTNELLLTATLIRYQPLLKEAMLAHEELYKKDVVERIKSETNGKFETLLVKICEHAHEAATQTVGFQADNCEVFVWTNYALNGVLSSRFDQQNVL